MRRSIPADLEWQTTACQAVWEAGRGSLTHIPTHGEAAFASWDIPEFFAQASGSAASPRTLDAKEGSHFRTANLSLLSV